MIKGSKYW